MSQKIMSEKMMHIVEYQKYKIQLLQLEKDGQGDSKTAHQIRATLIPIWNRLTPDQQKEMAFKYIPPGDFLP